MKKYIGIGEKVNKLLMISSNIEKENLLCIVPSPDITYNTFPARCLKDINYIKEYECKDGDLEIKLTPWLDAEDRLFVQQFLAKAKCVTIAVQMEDNETSFIQTVLLAKFAFNLGIEVRVIICTTAGLYGAAEKYIEFLGQFIRCLPSTIEYYQVALNQWAEEEEDDFIIDTSGELFNYI